MNFCKFAQGLFALILFFHSSMFPLSRSNAGLKPGTVSQSTSKSGLAASMMNPRWFFATTSWSASRVSVSDFPTCFVNFPTWFAHFFDRKQPSCAWHVTTFHNNLRQEKPVLLWLCVEKHPRIHQDSHFRDKLEMLRHFGSQDNRNDHLPELNLLFLIDILKYVLLSLADDSDRLFAVVHFHNRSVSVQNSKRDVRPALVFKIVVINVLADGRNEQSEALKFAEHLW